MLQQILETMYVDPELLELMSEEQKQLLFRKMREEQLRRWRERERERTNVEAKRTPRRIAFLLGGDGEPWTWVMGEHCSDLPYDELVRQRERREREREEEEEREIRREAEEIAQQETGHILSLASMFGAVRPPSPQLGKRHSLQPSDTSKMPVRRLVSDSSIQVAGGRSASLTGPLLAIPESLSSSMPRTESQLDLTAITEHIDGPSRSHDRSPDTSRQRPHSSDDLRKKTLTKSATTIPTIGKTREEQRQFQARRAEEIYSDMREVKQLERQRSTKVARSVEQRWKESEEKAKAFERTRKASFNKARQISKKHPNIDETQLLEGIPEQRKKELQQKIMTPARHAPQQPAREDRGRSRMRKSSIVRPGTKPKTQDHVVIWFRENEAPRGRCRERDGTICLWFHGRLGRTQAEGLLEERSVGSYLVRLSANNWGYTISVKGYENVKHFIVDVSSGQYQFSGVERRFSSLRDLLTFYRGNPITRLGQEILLVPVAQLEDEDSVNFRGLFREVEPKEAKITHL